MYRTNIHILVSAKCLDSPCTVCFLLPSCSTFNGMYCSCYYCLVIVVITLLVIVVCFAPWFPLDCFRSYLSHRIVACFSICTRKFFFHSVLYALVSQSLFALLSLFGTEVARNSFPDSLVLGRFMRVLLSRGSFEVDYQSSRRSISVRRSSKTLEIRIVNSPDQHLNLVVPMIIFLSQGGRGMKGARRRERRGRG